MDLRLSGPAPENSEIKISTQDYAFQPRSLGVTSTSLDFRFLSLFIRRAREGLASAHQANKLCYNNHEEVQMNFTGVITTCLRIAMFLMVLFIINTEPKCQSFLLTVSTAFHHDLSWSGVTVAPKYLFEKSFLL